MAQFPLGKKKKKRYFLLSSLVFRSVLENIFINCMQSQTEPNSLSPTVFTLKQELKVA